MDKKEVIEGLKSAMSAKLEALEAKQAEGAEAIKELDEARASGDEGRVSSASEKVTVVGEDIKAAQKEIEDINDQLGWFKGYQTPDEVKSSDEERIEQMRELFDSLKSGVATAEEPKRTVGEHFANLLKYRGIQSAQDVVDRKAETQLTVLLGKTPDAKEILNGLKNIKSIYANGGTEFLDGSGDPVPGFMGVQCGLVEDYNITCLIEPPQEDFENCITQANIVGNRLRFTREVARNDQAASVLETIYNPYPDFAQDGTKPEGDFTLATVEVAVSKIAEFVTASDEVLEDCPSVASLIDNFLISGVNKEKRRQLIAGTGLNGEMRGILNQPDVLTRTHQDTGAGGTLDDNFYDTFRRSLTDLWFQGASTDNVCIVMNPRDAEIIDLTKDELGRYLFNDSDCFNRMLRCMQIRVSANMPQGTAVLGDFSNNWVFYTRKALDIRMGYTGDQFITNTNTILGEMRGLSILRCPRKTIKISGLG
jgi:hypothetical protein